MKQRELIVRFLRSLISYGACPDKSDYFDKASRNPYEENARNKSAFNGVPSGFMALDRVTMGWQPSDLIIIAARPSMGKTVPRPQGHRERQHELHRRAVRRVLR